MFIACHPVLSPEARVALTLRLLGGLTTDEIARAFLVPEPTVAQRIVRAKRTLAAADVPFELPSPHELGRPPGLGARGRLPRVQRGLRGDRRRRLVRPELCERGAAPRPRPRRVGPRRARGARPGGADGAPGVAGGRPHRRRRASRCLLDQDRGRWDQARSAAASPRSARVEALGGAPGPYALQAAIAACHARARTASDTDWGRIAALYDALAQLTPSPVVELNRAVALSRAFGPAAGLALVDGLVDEPSLRTYHLLPSVRGDLLDQLGRHAEARHEFERAASLTRNARERAVLLGRAAQCAGPDRPVVPDPGSPG